MLRQLVPPDYVDQYRVIPYPRGSSYVPVSYKLGTVYISANTHSPEACYRWLRTISHTPDLFWGVPARHTAFDDPALAAALGPDVVAFYRTFVDLLADPNAVIFPDLSAGNMEPGDFIVNTWLNRAFDRYVLEDADLEAELADAQLLITAYQECIAGIAPLDPATQPTEEQEMAWYEAYTQCAFRVDPSLEERLGS
jgi:hypothetical protein